MTRFKERIYHEASHKNIQMYVFQIGIISSSLTIDKLVILANIYITTYVTFTLTRLVVMNTVHNTYPKEKLQHLPHLPLTQDN